jgi:hypothetical protein
MKGRKAEAGSPLAIARLAAHKAFDSKWQSGGMSRSAAYRWLAKEMGMTRDECHMFQMLETECWEVVRICTIDSFEDLTR